MKKVCCFFFALFKYNQEAYAAQTVRAKIKKIIFTLLRTHNIGNIFDETQTTRRNAKNDNGKCMVMENHVDIQTIE